MVGQLGDLVDTDHCRKALQRVKAPQQFVQHLAAEAARDVRALEPEDLGTRGGQVFFAFREIVVEKLFEERIAVAARHGAPSQREACSLSAEGSNGLVM